MSCIARRIIICGRTGSGKDYLKNKFSEMCYKSSVSTTTRPMRQGERESVDYYYVSNDKFEEMKKNNDFYEYKTFGGWQYGTSLKSWMESTLFILTPSAIVELSDEDRRNSIIIYLDIDEQIRIERLKLRGDDENIISKRIETDKKHFENFELYDHRVTDPLFTLEDILKRIYS